MAPLELPTGHYHQAYHMLYGRLLNGQPACRAALKQVYNSTCYKRMVRKKHDVRLNVILCVAVVIAL